MKKQTKDPNAKKKIPQRPICVVRRFPFFSENNETTWNKQQKCNNSRNANGHRTMKDRLLFQAILANDNSRLFISIPFSCLLCTHLRFAGNNKTNQHKQEEKKWNFEHIRTSHTQRIRRENMKKRNMWGARQRLQRCVCERLCECASEYVNKTYPLQKLEQPSLCEWVCVKHLDAPVYWLEPNAMCCLCFGCVRLTTRCCPMSLWIYSMRARVCVRTKCYRCSDARKGWFHLTRNDRRMILASTIHNLQKFHSFFIFSFCSSVPNSAQNDDSVNLCFALHNFFFLFASGIRFFFLSSSVIRGFPNENSISAHTMPITYFMPFYYWLLKWSESNNENASVAQIIPMFSQ